MASEKKTIELTYDKAVELLDRAVEERGEDYIYEPPDSSSYSDCAYFHGEKPGCIVGQALAYAGLGRDDLRGRGNILGDLNRGAGPHRLVQFGVLRADTQTKGLLAAAQENQDAGAPWGEAVEIAKQRYPKIGAGA